MRSIFFFKATRTLCFAIILFFAAVLVLVQTLRDLQYVTDPFGIERYRVNSLRIGARCPGGRFLPSGRRRRR